MYRMRFVCCGLLWAVLASQSPAQVKPSDGNINVAGASDLNRKQARAIVEGLVNRNPTPKIENETPTFDAKFDWAEYDRAWYAFRSLASRGPEAWSDLVASLDDDRYSTTFESISGSLRQWSVGHASREILGRNLAAAYYQHIVPQSPLTHFRLAIPDIARDRKGLKAWCEERRGRQLYELQIECCEWAIGELSEPGDYARIGADKRKEWIDAIKRQIEQLRTTKEPVRFRGFGAEEFDKFSEPKGDPFAPVPFPSFNPASKK